MNGGLLRRLGAALHHRPPFRSHPQKDCNRCVKLHGSYHMWYALPPIDIGCTMVPQGVGMAKTRGERIAELGQLAEMSPFPGLEVLQQKAARAVSKSFAPRRKKKKPARKRRRRRA